MLLRVSWHYLQSNIARGQSVFQSHTPAQSSLTNLLTLNQFMQDIVIKIRLPINQFRVLDSQHFPKTDISVLEAGRQFMHTYICMSHYRIPLVKSKINKVLWQTNRPGDRRRSLPRTVSASALLSSEETKYTCKRRPTQWNTNKHYRHTYIHWQILNTYTCIHIVASHRKREREREKERKRGELVYLRRAM